MKLNEWQNNYTGRFVFVQIQYILRNCPEFGLMEGFVVIVFFLKPIQSIIIESLRNNKETIKKNLTPTKRLGFFYTPTYNESFCFYK